MRHFRFTDLFFALAVTAFVTACGGGSGGSSVGGSIADDLTIVDDLTNVYTVTFDYNDGKSDPSIFDIVEGDAIEEPKEQPKREHFHFEGWHKDKQLDAKWDFDEDIVTSDIILYAKWEFDDEQQGKKGTEDDPFLIHDADTLRQIGKGNWGLDKRYYFKQICDIDMTGEPFTAIGTSGSPFKGTFDGGGYIITNLVINNSSGDNQGLFGVIYGLEKSITVVKNVGLVGGSIKGKDNVGGVVGHNDGGIVENSYNTGIVIGHGESVGGIVGNNNGGTVKNCYAAGDVTGADNFKAIYVGGVAGQNSGTVANCYAIGNIKGDNYVGGVIGWHHNNTDTVNCVALNSVVEGAKDNIGRVVGIISSGGKLEKSYARDNMKLSANGGDVTVTGTKDSDKNGADITEIEWHNANWWKNKTIWHNNAWDTGIWNIMDDELPTLKIFSGTQNPQVR